MKKVWQHSFRSYIEYTFQNCFITYIYTYIMIAHIFSTARNVQWFQANGQLLPSCVLWVRSHMGQHDVLTRDILCVLFINESKVQRDKRHVPSTGVVFFKYKKSCKFYFQFLYEIIKLDVKTCESS